MATTVIVDGFARVLSADTGLRVCSPLFFCCALNEDSMTVNDSSYILPWCTHKLQPRRESRGDMTYTAVLHVAPNMAYLAHNTSIILAVLC